jgi:hypothetical protein
MKYFLIFFILLFSTVDMCSAAENVKETPHYNVVAEYVRSLGSIYRIQKIADKELQEDEVQDSQTTNTNKLMTSIRSSTRFKLELNASISALESMNLNKPYDELLASTIFWYKKKIELYDTLVKISKAFLDPKDSVDYSGLVAEMPEITANIEYADESIFQSMVLVFALLIDMNPDSEGHMSHLNISKTEKQKLIDTINISFGDSLEKKDKNWTVSSAALLKSYLLKDYKCTDEWK